MLWVVVVLQLSPLRSHCSSLQGQGTRRYPDRSLHQPGFQRGAQLPGWALITAELALKMIALGCKQLAYFSSSYRTSSQPVAEDPQGGIGRTQRSLPVQGGSHGVSSGGLVWGGQRENKSPWWYQGARSKKRGTKHPLAYFSTNLCGGCGPGSNVPPSAASSWGHSPVPTWFLFLTNPFSICLIEILIYQFFIMGTPLTDWAWLPSQASS